MSSCEARRMPKGSLNITTVTERVPAHPGSTSSRRVGRPASAPIPGHRRRKFKESFFGGVFFCENRPVTRQAELSRSHFPNVYEVVREIKRKDYRHLAHTLQRVESSLIVNRVARRCMD